MHSVLGKSSIANDLVAGHAEYGSESHWGPFCQSDPGPMEDKEVSDLVAKSATFFYGLCFKGLTFA